MLGGPVMNLVIAFVLMGIVMVGFGLPTLTPRISGVSECVIPASAPADQKCTSSDVAAPAAAAGIEPGDHDRVVRRRRHHVLGAAVRAHPASGAQPVPVVVERDGTTLDLTVTPVVARPARLRRPRRSRAGPRGQAHDAVRRLPRLSPSQEMVRQSLLSVPGVVADTTWRTMTVVATLPSHVGDLVRTEVNGTQRDANSIVRRRRYRPVRR